ncbi:hypothetical protein JYU34_012562, partial [Plutella xylostella]
SVGAVLAQGRARAAARLPAPAPRVQCAITAATGKSPRLVVATSAGDLYMFALDPVEGGDCTLLRTHSLLPRDNTAQEDSLRDREIGAALEGSPPRGSFDLRDPRHFPPMRTADTGDH